MKHFIIAIVGLVISATQVCAQYDPSFAHYWAMEPSFNPASVGKEAKLNVAGAYSLQLAGFENNPKTMYVAADMPFYAVGSYHGVGVQLLNDEIGLFSHKRLSVQYAYQKRLLGGKLSAGVQVGMLGETFDGSKVELGDDPDDPAFASSSVNGTGLDLSAGVYYVARNWYVGLSALHLNSPVVAIGETNELSIDPTYYFTAGYNIRLTYSPTNSVTVLIGGNFHGIHLGYSYEIYTSAINVGNGSHELFVGYQTEVNLYKKGRNLHKSVRLL